MSIKVREKKIAGYLYVPAMGQNAYFNKDGVVVETSSRKLEGMMEVTGLESVSYTHLAAPVMKEIFENVLPYLGIEQKE